VEHATPYAYLLTAPAGATGVANAVQVPRGHKYKLNKTTFIFPPGSGFYLQLKVLHGVMPVVPKEGYIVGDGHAITVECDEEYGGEEYIKIWYNNTDGSNSHQALIVFEGKEVK